MSPEERLILPFLAIRFILFSSIGLLPRPEIPTESLITILISSFQIHSLEGEAIQMHGMWEGFLSVENLGCSQDTAYGGIAAQVSSVQS